MPRPVVLEAVRGALTYQMSYRDAQIWAPARMNQIPVVLSEDFGEEKTIEGVHFVNPSGSNFNIDAWLPLLRST